MPRNENEYFNAVNFAVGSHSRGISDEGILVSERGPSLGQLDTHYGLSLTLGDPRSSPEMVPKSNDITPGREQITEKPSLELRASSDPRVVQLQTQIKLLQREQARLPAFLSAHLSSLLAAPSATTPKGPQQPIQQPRPMKSPMYGPQISLPSPVEPIVASTPDKFASATCEDFRLPSVMVSPMTKQIQEQLAEHKAIDLHRYINSNDPVIESGDVVRGTMEQRDEVWWEGFRKRLRTGRADGEFVKSGQSDSEAEGDEEWKRKAAKGAPLSDVKEEEELTILDVKNLPAPADLKQNPGLRIMVKVWVIHGPVAFRTYPVFALVRYHAWGQAPRRPVRVGHH